MADIRDVWNKFGFKMPIEGSNFVVNCFDNEGTTELTFIYDPRSDLMSDNNYKKKHPVIGKFEVTKVFAHEKYAWQLMEIKLKKEDVNDFYDILGVLDEAYDIMYEEDYREMKTLFHYYTKEGEKYVKNNPDGGDRKPY